ncbi:MAG: PadR family transcriptional regulator [Planctomycetes bacterium RBG_13_63_9]|nr:MAG: PadR family transcriptional regulator [Planctomycetes bacterium RBG_13_63_9]
MSRQRTNPDFLNGVPELVILQFLSRRPMYGYELVQSIRDETERTLEFGEGCVYPILHKLEKQGVLNSRRETVGGRSRVVYRVTQSGSKRLARSVAHWTRIVQAVNQVLSETGSGPIGRHGAKGAAHRLGLSPLPC